LSCKEEGNNRIFIAPYRIRFQAPWSKQRKCDVTIM